MSSEKVVKKHSMISDILVWKCPDGHTSPYYRGDCFLYYDFPKHCQTCGKEMETEEIRNGDK